MKTAYNVFKKKLQPKPKSIGQQAGDVGKALSTLGVNLASSTQNNIEAMRRLAAEAFARSRKTLDNAQNQALYGLNKAAINPNPAVNTLPREAIGAGQAWSDYAKAPTFKKLEEAKLKTAIPVARVVAAPLVGAKTYIGSTVLGGAFGAGAKIVENAMKDKGSKNVASLESLGKLTKGVPEAAFQGAQQGVVNAPIIGAMSKVTNPAITKAASKVINKLPPVIANKISDAGKDIINRVIQGTLSIPEGKAMATALGREYTLVDAAIDFSVGSGLATKVGTDVQAKAKQTFPEMTPDQKLNAQKGFIETFKANADKFVVSHGLTPYSKEEYANFKVVLAKDKSTGYAIKPDGDLISVFNQGAKGSGKYAVMDAIENGATKLDCFDGGLARYYEKFGFEEYDRMKWDDQYAPDGWNYDTMGRPDIVSYKLNPKKYADYKNQWEGSKNTRNGDMAQPRSPVFERNFRPDGRGSGGTAKETVKTADQKLPK